MLDFSVVFSNKQSNMIMGAHSGVGQEGALAPPPPKN